MPSRLCPTALAVLSLSRSPRRVAASRSRPRFRRRTPTTKLLGAEACLRLASIGDIRDARSRRSRATRSASGAIEVALRRSRRLRLVGGHRRPNLAESLRGRGRRPHLYASSSARTFASTTARRGHRRRREALDRAGASSRHAEPVGEPLREHRRVPRLRRAQGAAPLGRLGRGTLRRLDSPPRARRDVPCRSSRCRALRPVCKSAGDRYADTWLPCGAGPFKLEPGRLGSRPEPDRRAPRRLLPTGAALPRRDLLDVRDERR